ncbi:class I SAM-dependent methyltransferase [Neorhizobium sp. JUb45]|uniref:class I SAM-dependent methyltransferase n=1 Tax=unclassified Neorhizobium TaxID=2629175 RepID=UPI00104AA6D8|nr:class I SAM-dependent methyltransferase [Neorhizobium sp. JUb45]TCR07352.1 methyltransferase family protein [Neorhizobium sp. JUb45]
MNQIKLQFDGHSLITPKQIADEMSVEKAEDFDRQFAVGKGELSILLELARQQFEKNDNPTAIIDRVTLSLHELRGKLHQSVWQDLVPFIQNHPVAAYFLEDPLTRWSWDKPRGYSGDASLLDLIYRHDCVSDMIAGASERGRALFEYTSTAPSSQANWDRRDILARFVDEVAAEKGPETEVLSIAAGHLREVECSQAAKNGGLKRYVALDQDPVSIGTITRDYAKMGVEAIDGSVRQVLAKRIDPGQFDLVYASGLYDYLVDKVAIKLTQRALDMLKPGGTFLFANYSYPIVVDGYIETFMNWQLLLRSEADMWNIIHACSEGGDYETSVFFGKNRNIVYGVMKRKD